MTTSWPRTWSDRERGSVSLFVILMATVTLIMIGLVVDGAGHVQAMQQARAVAREAARAGGQHLNAPPIVRGHEVTADPHRAAAAANAYLALAEVSGSATVTGPNAIRVDVTSTYAPVFLSVIGIGALTATGSAEARSARAIGGVEQ